MDTAKIQLELISVPSKVRNCAVSPDHLRIEISFSSTFNIPKHWWSRKTRYLDWMWTFFLYW